MTAAKQNTKPQGKVDGVKRQWQGAGEGVQQGWMTRDRMRLFARRQRDGGGRGGGELEEALHGKMNRDLAVIQA